MTPGDMAFDPSLALAHPVQTEFPDGLHWVNRRESVHLADLRGHIVLMVFWNGTSASCANLLVALRLLENRLPDAFVPLLVHTPRYTSQQSDAAVLQIAERNRVRAPVANDADWLVWKQFEIGAWPTLLLIDAAGRLVARLTGAGRLKEVEDAVVEMRAGLPSSGAALGVLAERGSPRNAAGPLAFPAHALATDKRLYISDTGHHRILECTHGGRVIRQFGSGTPGHWDGQFAASGFRLPQGLALARGVLYVADTGNHCVRRIGLEEGEVDTVLGTGRAAWMAVEAQGGAARIAINAPQAVAVDEDWVYVAAAGQHQILRCSLPDGRAQTLAGDACSELRDGAGVQCSLSQPAALALLPGQLLVADAGANAVRRWRFADGSLTTLAGSSPWEPGCRDGLGREARLAFPSGIAAAVERVFVADTCNDRLCALNPYSGELTTFELDVPLHEPQGLSFAAGSLWIADRNAHAILRVDLDRHTAVRVPVEE